MYKRNCRKCGKPFKSQAHNKFLCDECKIENVKTAKKTTKRRYKKRANYTNLGSAKCLICGKEFVKKVSHQMLCGERDCLLKSNRKKPKEIDPNETRCPACKKSEFQCLDCRSIDIAGRPLLKDVERISISTKPFRAV